MPHFSIIMPAYNAEKYIEESIVSVQRQTFKHWELIVVDDGSTDLTSKIVNSLKEKDQRIIYTYQQNKRLGAARNTGIRQARGEWIAFLDADDIWNENKLEKQSEVVNSSQVDVIFSNGYIFYNEDLNNLESYPTITGVYDSGTMYKMEYERNYIPVLSVLVRKSLIDKIGFQEEHPYFNGCEDWDYWLRMAKANAVFFGMREKLFYYRRHTTNMSKNNTAMTLAQASAFIKNYDKSLFTVDETDKIFGPLINPLVCNLIKSNKIKEAKFILSEVIKITSKVNYMISYFIIRLLGRNSFVPVAVCNKACNFFFK